MTFSAENQPQPTQRRGRGPSARVTKADAVAALRRLREAASSGDVAANAALIALAEGRPLERFTHG